MSKKILLFTLQTFSTTGGIQKMTRTLAHSLNQISAANNWDLQLYSAYDTNADLMPQYLPSKKFRGFGAKGIGMGFSKVDFAFKALQAGAKADVIILSHINLALVGVLIKLINPKCKFWLVAHGIEVWRPLTMFQRKFIRQCERIICVSRFTRKQMIKWHRTDPKNCVVLNNVIDPFMKLPDSFDKPQNLLNRYKISRENIIIFTLTRLAATEQYKGHEHVIQVIGKLKSKFPNIRYILSGKYDIEEGVRINEMITANQVEEQVILTGFIDESELPEHFLLADLFVLPSKKEGFGIVFIEALACGLPVICGNADGSIDAIRQGELGDAVDVDNLAELERTITMNLNVPLTIEKRKYLQKQCMFHFNEEDYMASLEELLQTA